MITLVKMVGWGLTLFVLWTWLFQPWQTWFLEIERALGVVLP